MASLTINVEEDIIRRARIRALEQGTSVNAVLGEYLRGYAGDRSVQNAMKALGRLAKQSSASSGEQGRTWTREELYDR